MCRELFTTLVAAGVPINQTDRFGSTALDSLLMWLQLSGEPQLDIWTSLIWMLMDCDLEITTFTLNSLAPNTSLKTFYLAHQRLLVSENGSQAFDLPDLTRAILSRSETELDKILDHTPATTLTVSWGKNEGYILETAANWPVGIMKLLNHGVSVHEDDDGTLWTPLEYACACNLESCKILIAAGSCVTSSTLQVSLSRGDSDIQSVIISALVDRRSQLKHSAKKVLPLELQERYNLEDDRILDAHAFDVYKAICRIDGSEHRPLDPGNYPYTVYHCRNLTRPIAEKLYQAGFRDIDHRHDNGALPVMVAIGLSGYFTSLSESLEYVQWLWSKGVNVHQVDEFTKTTPALALGDNLDFFSEPRRVLELIRVDQAFLAEAFLAEITDDCACYCSPHGCCTVSRLFKLPKWYRTIERSYTMSGLLEPMRKLAPWLDPAIIRALTFDKLELSHTCHLEYKY
ncbi:uncharacterized protein BDZ99DRAFT_29023 [Mytilinidion resinicola]|uniref:Ankyrin n=1 Tax=Mytilinidion resinicola TaxID=574789 RepID=A0A6A6YLN0_9PEZI|nr:uncharacterized protein BDZ99DRAFT_29023 [Mytilinidion resinicola]KAF2809473.1 hypothetical protein BDZ99DRAFT_29023 [Mytilinidion resinicola]